MRDTIAVGNEHARLAMSGVRRGLDEQRIASLHDVEGEERRILSCPTPATARSIYAGERLS